MFDGQPSPDTVPCVLLRRGPENGPRRSLGQGLAGGAGCAGRAGQPGGVVPVFVRRRCIFGLLGDGREVVGVGLCFRRPSTPFTETVWYPRFEMSLSMGVPPRSRRYYTRDERLA